MALLSYCRRDRVTEQVVIGTHGRLHQWMNRRLLPARNLKILVFDEADEMLKVKCCSVFAPDSPLPGLLLTRHK